MLTLRQAHWRFGEARGRRRPREAQGEGAFSGAWGHDTKEPDETQGENEILMRTKYKRRFMGDYSGVYSGDWRVNYQYSPSP